MAEILSKCPDTEVKMGDKLMIPGNYLIDGFPLMLLESGDCWEKYVVVRFPYFLPEREGVYSNPLYRVIMRVFRGQMDYFVTEKSGHVDYVRMERISEVFSALVQRGHSVVEHWTEP